MNDMKASRFNVFQQFEDEILAYNSFKDSFLILEPTLHQLFEAAKTEMNFMELKMIHPSFYEALFQNGFVVPEEEDELAKVVSIRQKTDFNNDHFRLIINPTMNCNFKCWYCYETHIKESRMETEIVQKVKRLIDNIFEDNRIKTFELSWFGGEPLLYYHKIVDPILTYATQQAKISGKILQSDFTTNGFLINQEMLDSMATKDVAFQITLDGHREKHNKVRYVNETRGSYDEILSNIILLCKNGFYVTLRINYTSETLVDVQKIADDLSDLPFKDRKFLAIDFQQVWQSKSEDLVERIRIVTNYFRTNDFRISSKLGNGMTGSCYADKLNEAVINYNGDVFKCTARDFTEDNREGILTDDGIILWNNKKEERLRLKLNNKPCQECAILPICGGGCSQIGLDHAGEDYCVHNFDINSKHRLVKLRFLDTMDVLN